MFPARRLCAALSLLCLGVVLLLGADPCTARTVSPGRVSAAVSARAVALLGQVEPFMTQLLGLYASSVDGPFRAGVWVDPGSDCWACDNGGPATAAATLYVLGAPQRQHHLQEAVATMNTAIATQREANGGFAPPPGDPNPEGIVTGWFGVELGMTETLLAPELRAHTRRRWSQALAGAAEYLIGAHNLTWYTNGNINLVYIELMWEAWRATHQPRFLSAYEAGWAFLEHPPQGEFPGAGWLTMRPAGRADGSDGSGAFAEIGPGGAGYDPYYVMLQLDVLARLYLLTGDPRVLRAANMELNLELPRVDPSTWTLNQSDGTRHTGTQGPTIFLDAAMGVLALQAHRSDLLTDLLPQLGVVETQFHQSWNIDSPSYRRAFGNSVATLALAAGLADPTVRARLARLGLAGTLPGRT